MKYPFVPVCCAIMLGWVDSTVFTVASWGWRRKSFAAAGCTTTSCGQIVKSLFALVAGFSRQLLSSFPGHHS